VERLELRTLNPAAYESWWVARPILSNLAKHHEPTIRLCLRGSRSLRKDRGRSTPVNHGGVSPKRPRDQSGDLRQGGSRRKNRSPVKFLSIPEPQMFGPPAHHRAIRISCPGNRKSGPTGCFSRRSARSFAQYLRPRPRPSVPPQIDSLRPDVRPIACRGAPKTLNGCKVFCFGKRSGSSNRRAAVAPPAPRRTLWVPAQAPRRPAGGAGPALPPMMAAADSGGPDGAAGPRPEPSPVEPWSRFNVHSEAF